MVEDALRGVLREALQASVEGLPGDHHFYITFRTRHPQVDIPDYIRARYPDEMTIVLQHQYWGLEITPDWFEVTLSFNRVNERLHIPFASVSAFADPSAKFGLQFQTDGSIELPHEGGNEDGELAEDGAEPFEQAEDKGESDDSQPNEQGAQVIALDAFRKK
ncbi:MAG TPA: ClpXP protease specificity-enhancing factor SspB [Candidatus Sulfotelmatobacter sp.]|nr:ClpXP protease specificity-enhancing factor SspB [Candidatus Sulfotelmatobacter sp.]